VKVVGTRHKRSLLRRIAAQEAILLQASENILQFHTDATHDT
jgi:hypothetical protein